MIGLGMLSLGVWVLLVMATLHDSTRRLRTMDLSGLRAFQSEITAIQHLARIKSALERSPEHSTDSKPPNEKN